MKPRIILSYFALALFALLINVSYGQQSCCEDKSSACCTEGASCCGDKAATESSSEISLLAETNGLAAGDSTMTTSSGAVCLVSGEAIGEGQGLKFDYYGTTYNFCCEGCLAKFKKEPMDHIKAGGLTCPVMGDAIEDKNTFVTHNGTKYYLCCKSCVKSFEKDPEKYMGGYKQ